MSNSVKVKGLRALNRAFKQYDAQLKVQLEKELVDAAAIVAASAQARFMRYYEPSARTIRPKLRGYGRVVVQQQRRKKTGKRPDFGALQMRKALIPGLEDNEQRVIDHVEQMLDRIGREEGF